MVGRKIKRIKYQLFWKTLLISFLLIFGLLLFQFENFSSANTFSDTTQADFDEGTYTNTSYNTTSGFVQLNASNTSGTFTSRAFNARGIAQWNNISWNYEGAPCLGTGADGVLNVVTSNTVINNYTYLTGNELSGETSIVVNNGSAFTNDSEILIIQIQNGTGLGKAGNYEFRTIVSGGGTNTLTLDSGLENSYGSGTFNTDPASATQIVRIPQYTDVTVNSGANITASAWDGYTGGIVVFRATGTVTVNGAIDVSEKGYRGGYHGVSNNRDGAQGESWNGKDTSDTAYGYGEKKLPNNGGGGAYICGGGGEYAGGATDSDPWTGSGDTYARKGETYGMANLSKIFFGSGGGGQWNGNEGGGCGSQTISDGGDGGGIIIAHAKNIVAVAESFLTNGQTTYGCQRGSYTYGSSGGGGGSIYLNADSIQATTNFSKAEGGLGNSAPIRDGGDGGDGRIRLDYNEFTGSTSPSVSYIRKHIKLQVRSSDQSDCSDASFGDYLIYSTGTNLSVSNNTYFQYRAIFETNDVNVTPKLYNVTINYNLITTLDHYYVHTYHNNLSRSFFANNTQTQIRTNGTFTSIPTITIIDSNGTIRVNQQNMSNQSGEYYYYNYILNGSQGWYDVVINSQTWKKVFYQGELWQNNHTDADGNIFSFRRKINVTEPGIRERWFEPIDIQVNFTYEPNSNSARVLQYNGTNMLEIPSQIYNLNQTSGALNSANVVFLSTINKSETMNYYIATSKSNISKNYTTDLTYSNTSNQYTIKNSYFTSIYNTNTGGLMQDVYNKIGTNTSLSGLEPIDYFPQFEIGLTSYTARSDTSVNVDTIEGPILYRFNISGHANDDSSKPYSLNYKIYSKNSYIICEKNQSTTASQSWKNLHLSGLIFEDGLYTNVSYMDSTYDITIRALASGDNSDSTSLDSNMKWIAFYDVLFGNAVAELFLDKSFSTTSTPSMSICDESDYDYYRHLIIDSTQTQVSSGSSFYTKTARMIYNGLQEYSIVNETYENLLNPLITQQGSEETSDSNNPSYSNTGNISSDDQNNATCYSYWTDDSFLDYAIINITGPGGNDPATVLYQNTFYTIRSLGSFTNESWVNITLNASDLNAGHINCNIAVYDIGGNSNSTVIQFNISDNTSPVLNSINHEPNTNASLDPNIQINITTNITEYSNLSSITLQYKNSSQQNWQNKSMNKSWNNCYNYNYSANFTPTTAGTWQYRIFANDSVGNSYTSNITNLSVYYDWTWEHSPADFGVVSGLLGTNISVGNLTIDNTGDEPLRFKITSNWEDKNQLFFNDVAEGYTGLSFNLDPRSSINVSVNVTSKTTERSDGLNIIINALNTSAAPDDNTTTATIVSYASGPFLLVTIIEYPSSVTQEDTEVNLTVQVQNKGNQTATDIWLVWNLPSGWSVNSGSLTNLMENLNIDDIAYNSVIVNIGSSAPTGTKTITATANCSENKTGSDTASVVVIAKPDNGGGGGNGGTPGGGYTTEEVTEIVIQTILRGEKTISSIETFELVRGYKDAFPVTVKNIFFEDTILHNVSLNVTGYLAQYLQVSPEMINEIQYNESEQFNVTVISPIYMEKGIYQLTITITGEIIGNFIEMDLIDSRLVTLIIHEVSEEEAYTSLAEAIEDIDELESYGFYITKIRRIFEVAQNAFDYHEYEETKDLCDEIETMKENAISADSIIKQIKNSIEDNPLRSLSETKTILNLAIAAFEREDYHTAFMRANDAMTAFELEIKEFDIALFLLAYWWVILGFIIIIAIVGALLYRKMIVASIAQKIINLGYEEDNIQRLIIAAQKKRFKEKTISAEEYNRLISRYRKRISDIKTLRTKLRHKRVRLVKTRDAIKDLERENNEVINSIKELQEDYFNKHKVSKSVYTDQIESYNERLAEIEDERLTLEIMLAKGEKR